MSGVGVGRSIRRNFAKPVLFAVCLMPLIYLVWAALTDGLGTDPVKALIDFSGEWTLRFLVVTIAITPLRAWFGWGGLLRFRRMLGLYAWFYGSLHFVVVLTYLFGWDWSIAKEELSERPYIIAGFLAWLLMVPLGLTSNNFAVRKLRQNWRRLHRLVYPAVGLAWLHLAWQVRSSYLEAAVYGLIIFCLLIQRLKKASKSS